MAKRMGRYCKAYPAARLREFPGWVEEVSPLQVPDENGGETSPETKSAESGRLAYFYLQEDYTVTAGVFLHENVAFDNVTEEWKTFCRERLDFKVPGDTDAAPTVVDGSRTAP